MTTYIRNYDMPGNPNPSALAAKAAAGPGI